eukprot:s368_g6.t2
MRSSLPSHAAKPSGPAPRTAQDHLARAYTEAIRNCADTLQWQHVHVLLDEFTVVRGKQLDVIQYAAAIKVLGQARQWHQGLLLLEDARAQRLQRLEVAYTAAQAACSRSEAWQQALGLLSAFLAEHSVDEGKDAVFAAAIRACEKGSGWQLTASLLRDMENAALQPSLVARNAAMRACSLRWDVVLGIFSSLVAEELQPDEVSFGTAVTACEKGGQWELALSLLALLDQQRQPGNQVIYNAAISACEKGGEWEQAMRLLSGFPERRLDQGIISFNSAICACGQCEQWEQSLWLLSHLHRQLLRANIVTWSSAATSCERADAWEAALQLLSAMEVHYNTTRKLQTFSTSDASCLCELSRRMSSFTTRSLRRTEKAAAGRLPWHSLTRCKKRRWRS